MGAVGWDRVTGTHLWPFQSSLSSSVLYFALIVARIALGEVTNALLLVKFSGKFSGILISSVSHIWHS